MQFAKRRTESGKEPEEIVSSSTMKGFDDLKTLHGFVELNDDWVPKAPSKTSVFWSAFFDGPMGGLFGDVELPFSATSLFKAPATENQNFKPPHSGELKLIQTLHDLDADGMLGPRTYAAVRAMFTETSEERLKEILVQLDDSDLKRIIRAVRAAELEHAGPHETQ